MYFLRIQRERRKKNKKGNKKGTRRAHMKRAKNDNTLPFRLVFTIDKI